MKIEVVIKISIDNKAVHYLITAGVTTVTMLLWYWEPMRFLRKTQAKWILTSEIIWTKINSKESKTLPPPPRRPEFLDTKARKWEGLNMAGADIIIPTEKLMKESGKMTKDMDMGFSESNKKKFIMEISNLTCIMDRVLWKIEIRKCCPFHLIAVTLILSGITGSSIPESLKMEWCMDTEH